MILCMEINTRHFFLTIWMSSRSIDDINRSALIFWAAVVFLVNLYWFLFSLGGESSRPGNAIYMHRPVTETICIFCLVTSFIWAFFFLLTLLYKISYKIRNIHCYQSNITYWNLATYILTIYKIEQWSRSMFSTFPL